MVRKSGDRFFEKDHAQDYSSKARAQELRKQTVTSTSKLGIRAKLFFAFAAVSGTTVIAGAAAWLMFSQVRDLFHGEAERQTSRDSTVGVDVSTVP